jgi:hypothetical protein
MCRLQWPSAQKVRPTKARGRSPGGFWKVVDRANSVLSGMDGERYQKALLSTQPVNRKHQHENM